MLERRENRGNTEVQTVELRESPNGGPMITGYGIVFNSKSENLGFIETIDPGSVDKTLREADVRSCGNHDTSWLLGRVKSGTLRLFKDSRGVRYEVDINPNDPDGVRAVEKVRRGDWDGSSFSFEAVRDEWNWDVQPPTRRIMEMRLHTIEPVTFPAYPDSTVQASRAKAALSRVAEKLGHPVDRMVDALRTGEIRSLVNGTKENTVDLNGPASATASSSGANANVTIDYANTYVSDYADSRAVWTTAYINNLPDSAFLYIEPGGDKDAEGKTTPRTLRHFPYKDANGKVDLPHLRNALARIPDSNIPDDEKPRVTAKAKRILADNGGEQNSADHDTEGRAGAKFSKASKDQIRAAAEALLAMIADGEDPDDDNEPDSDMDDVMEPMMGRSMAAAHALVKVRQRELELIQQRHLFADAT